MLEDKWDEFLVSDLRLRPNPIGNNDKQKGSKGEKIEFREEEMKNARISSAMALAEVRVAMDTLTRTLKPADLDQQSTIEAVRSLYPHPVDTDVEVTVELPAVSEPHTGNPDAVWKCDEMDIDKLPKRCEKKKTRVRL